MSSSMYAVFQNGELLLWPLTSPPCDCEDETSAEVIVEDMPVYDRHLYKMTITQPYLVGGGWKAHYEQAALTELEVAMQIEGLYNGVRDRAQQILDQFAMTREYDNCAQCIGYFHSSNPYRKAEAEYMNQMRDAYWDGLMSFVTGVKLGQIAMPSSVAEVIATLPVLQWPIERPSL